MTAGGRAAREISGLRPETVPYTELLHSNEPVVLRGLVAHWPAVVAAHQSDVAMRDYLAAFDAGRPVTVYKATKDHAGRFFYNDTCTELAFERGLGQLPSVLDAMMDADDLDGACHYVGSTDLDTFLPGFAEKNPFATNHSTFAEAVPLLSIWFGNRTIASAHFDTSNNVACCVAGRRRFTLFPPDQIGNLYPGPLEPTPGGQVVSMVDFAAPDLDAHPRFAEALKTATVIELEPGDAVFYPALWWHHVEGLDAFNVLVNCWWNRVPGYVDTPWTTVLHGLLSLRSRPAEERAAWRSVFDHYLFGDPNEAAAHLPPEARGPLGPLDPATARRLRRQVIEKVNR